MRSFNFKVKLIGEEKYLTYTMGEETELDEDVLDYCEENNLKELVNIIYEEDDDYDYLTYDVTGQRTVDDLLAKELKCEQVLMILRNIANGLISLKEQAVKLNYILLNRQFVYVDELLNIRFICLPVESSGGLATEFKGFVRQFLANTKYDVDEDLNYVGKLLTYINGDNFNLRGLVGLSEALMEEAGISFEEVGGIEADGVEVMNSEDVEPDDSVKNFMESLADDADEPLPEIGDDEPEDAEEEAETDADDELDSILPAGMKFESDDAEDTDENADENVDENTDVEESEAVDEAADETEDEPANEVEDEEVKEAVNEVENKAAVNENANEVADEAANEAVNETATEAEEKAENKDVNEPENVTAQKPAVADEDENVVEPAVEEVKAEVKKAKPVEDSEAKKPASEETGELKQPEVKAEENAPKKAVVKETDPEVLKSRIKALAGEKQTLRKKEEVFHSEQEMDAFLGSKPPVIKKNSVKVNRAAIIQNIAASEEEAEAAEAAEAEAKEKEEQVPVIEEISENINQEKKSKSNSILSKTVEAPASPAGNTVSIVRAMPYLVRVNTDEKIMLRKEVFKLGRATVGVDYTVSGNKAVSRVHAIIVRRDDVSYIKDNKSPNHTFVNDKPVEEGEEAILTHDSVIKLGDEEFVFKIR
jgi:hypothetical protein